MENTSNKDPTGSKKSSSKEEGPIKGLTVESGSLEKLIKMALCEFDENGTVTRPPPVTIVLLTMHKWFVTSKELFAKVVQVYHKHKIGTRDSLTQNTFDDNVFDDKLNFDNSVHDLGSPRLPSIAETVESVEKLNEKAIVKEQNGSVPQIFINEVSDKLNSQGENSEQKSFTEEKQTNSKAAKVNTDPAMESLTNEPSDTNDNETCASVSASNGPTFNIAVDEPCVVERALATEHVPAEKPEVKVMCVKEELSVQKTKSRSDSEPDHQSASNCNSSDETEHEAENGETPVLNKWVVCQFLRYWMSKFGNDLRTSDNLLTDIVQFKKSLINENKEDEKRIKHLIGNSVVGSSELSGHSSKLVRQREVSRTKSLAFQDLSPKDIAEQLTHIDCRSLKKIPMSEWKTYARKPKLKNVQNLERYVSLFNGLSRWIEAMVLNGETPEIRAHIIQKFLNVAQCLRSHQNFNSLMAVIGALNHSALRRLRQTMVLLSDKKKKFLQEMTEFLSSEGNYANYRKELAKCEGFYVPILGVHLKDLIAVDTALPDYVTDRKLINFQKMVKFYTVIATLMNFKNMQPPAPSKFELINMLRLSIQMTITEDELYELSYAREPRSENSKSTTDTADSENSQLFADWASGRVTSRDPKTIDRHVTSMVEAVFKFYDRDSDGLLNTDDFEAISTNFPFIDSFGVVDADSDGVVTKEEMKNYFLKANFRALGRDFCHNFQETTYLTPSFCEHCGGMLWGLIKQGFKCKDCGINCHKACKGQVVVDCRIRTVSSSSSNINNTSTLERTAHKADAIRNKWKNRRKSRMVSNPENETSKTEESGMDEADSLTVRLEKSDQACKTLLEENRRVNDENVRLNNELSQAHEKIRTLQTQLTLVRQETITFVLEQLDALQLRRNTAV